MVKRPPGLWGKAVEASQAVRLELWLSKDEILTQMLNRAWFGAGAAGIEAAAAEIFDERASSLSLAESAALVALLPAPERLDPRVNAEAALRARDRVLDRMVATGRLNQQVAELAKREPMEVRRPPRPGLAPHLAVTLLAKSTEQTVQTTLDAPLQREVEDAVGHHLRRLAGLGIDHAAVLVVHRPTREIRAWVGSGDWQADDGAIDGVRVRRSPGSTLKPFTYGMAFETGSPADVLPDLVASYSTLHGSWTPGNYSGAAHGPVRARVALAASLNLAAVALLNEVGVTALHRRLRLAGVQLSAGPDTYGLGLVLGDAEVTLLDVVTAYVGLANGGVYSPIHVQPGAQRPLGQRFMDAEAAWMVQDVLADPHARALSFGRDGPLERSYDAAVKTGTSQGFRDNWTVGWAGDWVVGVWVGNFDARPMGRVSGVTGAAPLWASVMDGLVGQQPVRFERPQGWSLHEVCALSGEGRGDACPRASFEWLPADRDSPQSCQWHRADGIVWPAEYAAWAHAHDHAVWDASTEGPGQADILWPSDGAVIYIDPRGPDEDQALSLRATAPTGAKVAVWRVDGRDVATVGPPFHARWRDPTPGRRHIALWVDGQRAAERTIELRGVDLER
jgi:penicillin-binding protein 1C